MNEIYSNEEDGYSVSNFYDIRVIVMDEDEDFHKMSCECPRCIAMEMDY